MKGIGWMVGAVLLSAGFAAPSQAAVSAGNILAAPASVDNSFRQELRVQIAAADARAGTTKPAVETGMQAPQAGETQPADGRLVASDQLNDVDRALQEPTPARTAGGCRLQRGAGAAHRGDGRQRSLALG
jgi:hypothetical protein